MATVLMLEAGGEPKDGMLAVADVVMERVDHENWPNDICSVVQEPNQFAYKSILQMSDLIRKSPRVWMEAFDVARSVVVDGERLHMGATHFHSGKNPWWTRDAEYVGSYGGHKFWRLEK